MAAFSSPSQVPTPGVVPNQLEQTANRAAQSSSLQAPQITSMASGPNALVQPPTQPAIQPAFQPPTANLAQQPPVQGGTTVTSTNQLAPPPPPPNNPVGAAPTFNFPTGTTASPIDPNNSLRGFNIAPSFDPGVAAAAGQVDRANDIASTGLENLVPMDRGAIAQDVLSQLRESSQDGFNQDVRRIGQDAARFGNIGSGVTTTRLGDLASNREQDFARASRGLSSEAAGLALSDQRDVINTALGTGAQIGGTEASRFGQGADVRDELRGERDFENLLARLAQGDRIQQTAMQDDLLNSAVNRDNTRLDMQLAGGFGGNPAGVLLDSAGNRQNSANASGNAAAQLLFQQALNG